MPLIHEWLTGTFATQDGSKGGCGVLELRLNPGLPIYPNHRCWRGHCILRVVQRSASGPSQHGRQRWAGTTWLGTLTACIPLCPVPWASHLTSLSYSFFAFLNQEKYNIYCERKAALEMSAPSSHNRTHPNKTNTRRKKPSPLCTWHSGCKQQLPSPAPRRLARAGRPQSHGFSQPKWCCFRQPCSLLRRFIQNTEEQTLAERKIIS